MGVFKKRGFGSHDIRKTRGEEFFEIGTLEDEKI